MRTRKCQWMLFVSLLITCLTCTKVQALEEGDDFDTIVRQLQNSTVQQPLPKPERDYLGESLIHGGVGWTNSFTAIRTAGDQRVRSVLQGVQASLGIDLLSKNWAAEGTIRNYTDFATSSARVNLREFDLKVIHKGHFTEKLGYRIGVGLAARYMRVSETVTETTSSGQAKPSDVFTPPPSTRTTELQSEYSTPASLAMVGFDGFLSKQVSFGLETSYRSALVSDTIDKIAYDMLLRLDAHF